MREISGRKGDRVTAHKSIAASQMSRIYTSVNRAESV